MRFIVMVAFAAAISAAAGGCSANHLVFSTFTKVGLDVAVADSQPTSAMFGYKRFEGAIIPVDLCVVDEESDASSDTETSSTEPKYKAPCPAGTKEAEAMSVYAGMELNNRWVGGLELLQIFATGEAAENAAKNPEQIQSLVKATKRKEEEK